MTALDDRPTSPASRLAGWDSIEFYVGNARATAGFLSAAFGFTITAYAGPETGRDDIASYLLEQGDIRFVVTAGLEPESPIWTHVRAHGDGAQDLAFVVDDATATYEAAIARGATAVREPYELTDEDGTLRLAAIGTYGETKHTFVDRRDYRGHYCPGYVTTGVPPEPEGPTVGLAAIDHVVGNVEEGELDRWVSFYEDVMGFRQLRHFDEHQIATEFSALRSTVMTNDAGVTMPLNEPAEGRKRSQIQEYLDTYRGPGVQHLALATEDIVQAIGALRASRRPLPRGQRRVLRRRPRAAGVPRPAVGCTAGLGDPGRPRAGRVPAAAVHRADHRPADRVHRDHPTRRGDRVRRRQLQGAVRVDRGGAGQARQSLTDRR